MSSQLLHWPSSEDYNAAVQTPALCFADPDLAAAEVGCNALGLPAPRSGSFADVYQLRAPGRAWAVKCFTRAVPGLAARYAAVHRHLSRLAFPFTVGFEFLDRGIRVNDRWFPVVKMDWVEGHLLNAFARDAIAAPIRLEKLFAIWAKLADRLEGAGVTHGDLQHGNVLVVRTDGGKGAVTLVDYDGMGVPDLDGNPPGEAGHPAYQHPDRARFGAFGPPVDRFSALVIATALRAVRVGGAELWDRFDDGANLLFLQKDFEAPDTSPAFASVRGLDDPLTRHLTRVLEAACRGHLPGVPPLRAVLDQAPVSVGWSGGSHLPPGEGTRSEAQTDARGIPPAGAPSSPVPAYPASPSVFEPPRVAAAFTPDPGPQDSDDGSSDPPFVPAKPRRTKSAKARNRRGAQVYIVPAIAVAALVVTGVVAGPILWEKVRDNIGIRKPERSATNDPEPKPKPPEDRPRPTPPAPEGPAAPDPPRREPPGPKTDPAPKTDPTPVPVPVPTPKSMFLAVPVLESVLGRHTGGAVTWVAASDDSGKAASTGFDKTIRVWDLDRKSETAVLRGHTDVTWVVAFFPGGRRLVSGGQDWFVRYWTLAGQKEYLSYKHAGIVGHVDISEDGQRVVSSAWDRQTLLWGAGKATRPSAPLPIPATAGLRVGVFRPKHPGQLVVWTEGRSLQMWDTQLNVRVWSHRDVFNSYGPDKLLISPDGSFATVGTKQSARVADLNASPPAAVATVADAYELQVSRGFTGDGKYLLLGTGARGPGLWDWRSGREVFRCPPPPGLKAFSATLTPDDRRLIVGYDDGTVRLYRIRD